MHQGPTASPPLLRSSHEALIVLVLAVATALKAIWAATSGGSPDLALSYAFARGLQEVSLPFFYLTSDLFNQTPVTCQLETAVFMFARGDYRLYSAIFRFLSIGADIAVVLSLLQVRRLTGQPSWTALYLFALSPVAILISGFHGGIDPLLTMCLFLSGAAVIRGEAALAGALFAMACNFRAWPLLLLPLYVTFWRARGRPLLTGFGLAAGALLLIGNAGPLLNYPQAFLANLFGPGSRWGGWGIGQLLRATGNPALQSLGLRGPSPAQTGVIVSLLALSLALICCLAWRRRNAAPETFFKTLALGVAILLVLAPGAGPQQLVWVSPFLLFLPLRWWITVTAASTVYLLAFYQGVMKSPFPWLQPVTGVEAWNYSHPMSLLPWLALTLFLAWSLTRTATLHHPPPAPTVL